MRVSQSENEIEFVYDSVGDLAEVAFRHLDDFLSGESLDRSWYGVDSREEIETLATVGWQGESNTAMEIASEAIEAVEREHEMVSFHPVWDVAGCEVDVARFLSREPENMIDYEIVPVTRVGRVIVLCASVAYSGSISTDAIKRRGQAIAALAMALSQLGYATELWADMSIGDDDRMADIFSRTRVLVKGPNDTLDPAQIMFAYSHPAMYRALGLPALHECPERFHRALNIGPYGNYGYPANPKQDLPEGTIYLPSVLSGKDIPNADEVLLKYLRELGVLAD